MFPQQRRQLRFLHCVSVECVPAGIFDKDNKVIQKEITIGIGNDESLALDERQISFLVVTKMCDFVGRPFGENCGLC